MLSLLEQAFPGRVANPEWQKKLRRIVPNYRHKLNEDPEMLAMVWQDIETALQRAIPSPSIDGVNAGSTPNDNPADVKQVRDRPL